MSENSRKREPEPARLRHLTTSLRGFWVRVHNAYSPSAFLFAAVLALGFVMLATSFVLAHYFDVDVASSLTFTAGDGYCNPATEGLGTHCFGDYWFVLLFTAAPNPWTPLDGFPFNYPAAGMLPHWFFQQVGNLTVPRLGLIGYLLLLAAALAVPAAWASRGKSMTLKIIAFGAFGLLSIPALMTLDRGNSIGLVVPALLLYLVALRRERYLLVIVAITLAALVKPQFVLLIVVLLVVRKWRPALIALGAVIVTNALAFLVWPSEFPGTIVQSVQNTLSYGNTVPLSQAYPSNVSFAKGIHVVEWLTQRAFGVDAPHSWAQDHAGLIAPVIVALLVVALLLLGRRVPPVLAGIALMASAAIFPAISWSYYLVFALPVAAVLLRDPAAPIDAARQWAGVLDAERRTRLRTVAGLLIAIATAASITRQLFPVSMAPHLLTTSGDLVPLLWLLALIAIPVAWGLGPREISAQVDQTATARPSPAATPREA